MTSKFINRAFLQAVATAAPETTDKWLNQPFAKMRELQIDRRGYVGEHMIVSLLKATGREVEYSEGEMADGKTWDMAVDGLRYEIKTATIGINTETFQHENIYNNQAWDGVIFIDIAPDEIYISCWARHEINRTDLHLRKNKAFYKWDTSLKPGHKFCVADNRVRTLADVELIFRPMEESIKPGKTQ